MTIEQATLKDGKKVQYITDMIGEGAMKQVFFTADRQSVICFFKDQSAANDPSRMRRLESILGMYNPTLDPVTGKYFTELFCWPTGIVVQPKFGVMTPVYPANFFFGSGNLKGKEKQGKWFSSSKLRTNLPPGEVGVWLNYLQFCARMARAIRKMHLTGLAHSDLSSKNILVDPVRGRCIVIDVDSLVVPGLYPPDVLGTADYIAPEVRATQRLPLNDKNRKVPSNLTDLHALAVLIYEYLLRRHPLKGLKVNSQLSAEEDDFLSLGEKALFIEHPQDPSNRPAFKIKVPYTRLGPHLPKLFETAFIDGLHRPSLRPTAAQWERALYLSEDLLIPCGSRSCPEKWFLYNHGEKVKCPWCGWRLSSPLPMLNFHYSPRKGQFRPEGHGLVCWPDRKIYKWHVFANTRPVEGTDVRELASVHFYQPTGQWIIKNLNLDSMISPAGNLVQKGQATAIKEGDEVLLSKQEHGRLVTTRFIA